jgi:hypothetical protein
MDEQLVTLFHRHAVTAYDRRLRFAEFVANKAPDEKWAYDVSTALLSFGPKLKFEAPVLGSHASSNNSWLWAWANRNLRLTITNRALGDLVRVTVHRVGVPAMAGAGFSVEPLLGEKLTKHAADVFASILSRELEYDTYYTTLQAGYRSAILVRDDRLKFAERYPLHRVQTIFPKAVRALPITDARAALAHYARDYSLTVTELPDVLKISDGKGELLATFDNTNALKKLQATNVSAPPEKKPAPAKAAPKAVAKAKQTANKATAKKAASKKPAVKKPATKTSKPAPKKKPVAKTASKKPAKVVAKKPAKKR